MLKIPFPRSFYNGPSTNYEVGTVIRPSGLSALFGEIIEVRRNGDYIVRVDPSCGHFRETIYVNDREAIRPEEERVNSATLAMHTAERDVMRTRTSLDAALRVHNVAVNGAIEAMTELHHAKSNL